MAAFLVGMPTAYGKRENVSTCKLETVRKAAAPITLPVAH
jgi:hypothetical protein